MKVVRNIIVLVSLGLLGSLSASADVVEQTYLANCRKDPGVPIPTKVVSPTVGSEYAGSRIEVEFTVNQTGQPVDLTVKSGADSELSSAVMDAVRNWRFKPAERDGAPVSTRVVLPVRIVDAVLEGPALTVAD